MAATSPALRLVHGGADNAAADERILIEGIRARDASACDQLYRTHAPAIWRVLARILGNDPDLEDVHHEVFVQALRAAHGFRRDASLRTWLTSIAINCARMRLRSRRRRWWLRFVAPADLPERPAERDETTAARARAVYEVADTLPPDDRIVFALRYIEGMSMNEIVAATDVSLGTVKRRLARAKTRFHARARQHPELASLCQEREP